MFDMSNESYPQHRNMIPCQMKCFIDLRDLPRDNPPFGFEPGVYVIVDETWNNGTIGEQGLSSRLWRPYCKEAHWDEAIKDTCSVQRLVHLHKLRAPAIVTPDLGNVNPRAYLNMVPRRHWAAMFDDWLELPHIREFESD